jgi:hypothetical protein
MLRFFRQIRQKLIEQENVRKYVWYALGEILLVMIGILLALQVNNWNEERKINILESKLLKQVSVALEDDIEYFNMLNARMDQSQSSAAVITKLYQNDIKVDNDSLISLADDLVLGYLFVYNAGPYEAIKSTGLDIINNDEIREKLTHLYDFRLKRVDLALNEYNNAGSIYSTYHRNIIQHRPYLRDDGMLRYQKTLAVDNILQNEEFWILFRRAEYQSMMAGGRIRNTVPHMEDLKILIDNYLKE